MSSFIAIGPGIKKLCATHVFAWGPGHLKAISNHGAVARKSTSSEEVADKFGGRREARRTSLGLEGTVHP